MKTVVFATLLASAAAFAPSSEKAPLTTSALSANKFATEVGVTAPVSLHLPLRSLVCCKMILTIAPLYVSSTSLASLIPLVS